MTHHLLYCAYGTPDHTNECRFALARLLKVCSPATLARCQVRVYTDRGQDWEGFDANPLPFQLEVIDPATFQRWKGPHDFVYRVKLESLRHLACQGPGYLLMMDTDTHVRRDLGPLLDGMEAGQVYMHLNEGAITTANGFAEWDTYLNSADFPRGLVMWNSGVVGLPMEAVEGFIEEALEVTDRVYAALPRHICEQFALSYCLQQRYPVRAAEDFVHHYWSLKDFRRLLREVMLRPGVRGSLPRLAELSERILPERLEFERRQSKRQPGRLLRQLTGRSWKIEDYFGLFRDF